MIKDPIEKNLVARCKARVTLSLLLPSVASVFLHCIWIFLVPIKARHGCVTLSLKVERCRTRKREISNLSLQAQHGRSTRYILGVKRRVARDKFVLQKEEQITTIRRTSTKKTKSSPELGWRRGAPSCSTSAGPRVDLPPSAGSPRASHPDQEKHWKMMGFLTLKTLIGFHSPNNGIPVP